MTAPSNTTGAISKATTAELEKRDAGKTMKAYITQMKGEIAKALPSVMTPERFTRIVTSTLSANPKLAQTTPQSFLGAMMTAAQLGLEPNTPLGQAYLLPYKRKGVLECQFQIGYKGLIDLAYRSGEIAIIQAHEVCENDEFSYEFGLDPKLSHKPATQNRGKVIAYYAMFRTISGGFGFDVMGIDEVTAHAKTYSKSYGTSDSPWSNNFDEMAKKTVLKKVLKYAPLKSDFVRGIASDSTIKHEIEANMMDVSPIEAEYEVSDEEVSA